MCEHGRSVGRIHQRNVCRQGLILVANRERERLDNASRWLGDGCDHSVLCCDVPVPLQCPREAMFLSGECVLNATNPEPPAEIIVCSVWCCYGIRPEEIMVSNLVDDAIYSSHGWKEDDAEVVVLKDDGVVGLVDDVVVVDIGDVETWHLMRAGVIEEMCVVDSGNGEDGDVGSGARGGGGTCMEGESGEEEEERVDAPGVSVSPNPGGPSHLF